MHRQVPSLQFALIVPAHSIFPTQHFTQRLAHPTPVPQSPLLARDHVQHGSQQISPHSFSKAWEPWQWKDGDGKSVPLEVQLPGNAY